MDSFQTVEKIFSTVCFCVKRGVRTSGRNTTDTELKHGFNPSDFISTLVESFYNKYINILQELDKIAVELERAAVKF